MREGEFSFKIANDQHIQNVFSQASHSLIPPPESFLVPPFALFSLSAHMTLQLLLFHLRWL